MCLGKLGVFSRSGMYGGNEIVEPFKKNSSGGHSIFLKKKKISQNFKKKN